MGLFDWLSGEDEINSPEATAAIEELCRPDGWEVKCEIGSEPRDQLVAVAHWPSRPLRQAAINLRLGFGVDEGYVPPQGGVSLLAPSRFFSDESPRGFWKVDDDGDDGFPRQVQWRLRTSDSEAGLVLGGDTLLPPGAVYFNAKCEPTGRTDGPGIRLYAAASPSRRIWGSTRQSSKVAVFLLSSRLSAPSNALRSSGRVANSMKRNKCAAASCTITERGSMALGCTWSDHACADKRQLRSQDEKNFLQRIVMRWRPIEH